MNKKTKTWVAIILVLCVIAAVVFLATRPKNTVPDEPTHGPSSPSSTDVVESTDTPENTSDVTEPTTEPSTKPTTPSTGPTTEPTDPPVTPTEFDISTLTHNLYDGENAFIIINNNKPFFTKDEITTKSFETYGELDKLKRCTTCFACVGKDLMPTDDRESISSVYPTGWKYNGKSNNHQYDWVEGKYIYNRCHLIGFQLTGENANKQNLITGTRYLNIDGMLSFENMIADAVREDNLHVMYRVTPIYIGDNLVAEGLLLEAYSVEDKGETVEFCVFSPNVQPGVTIDYATGQNHAS